MFGIFLVGIKEVAQIVLIEKGLQKFGENQETDY
jgi:hypothetical protein